MLGRFLSRNDEIEGLDSLLQPRILNRKASNKPIYYIRISNSNGSNGRVKQLTLSIRDWDSIRISNSKFQVSKK